MDIETVCQNTKQLREIGLMNKNPCPKAKSVIVTGSFNGWATKDYRMVKEDDRWKFPVYLQPGKYTYKFIVDGAEIIDSANKLYE